MLLSEQNKDRWSIRDGGRNREADEKFSMRKETRRLGFQRGVKKGGHRGEKRRVATSSPKEGAICN